MARIVEVRIRSYEKFQKLLELEARQVRILKRIRQLREELLPTVKRLEDVEYEGKHFMYCRRIKWKFSRRVSKLMAQIKAQKKYEIENHIAEEAKTVEYVTIK